MLVVSVVVIITLLLVHFGKRHTNCSRGEGNTSFCCSYGFYKVVRDYLESNNKVDADLYVQIDTVSCENNLKQNCLC